MSKNDAVLTQSKSPFLAINKVWLVITLLVFLALVKLGFWQNSRAVEKTERLDRIAALVDEKSLSLFDIESMRNTLTEDETINDLPVIVAGELDEEVLFLLDNQMSGGKFGYRVLQLVHANSKDKKYKVLVNLGWVEGDRTRQVKPQIKVLSGNVSLIGHVRLIEKGIMLTAQDFSFKAWPMLIQQIELEKKSALLKTQLLPFVIYLDKNEQVGYEKNWQPVVMPPEKHLGYAFQWFSLAIAWLLLMFFAARKSQVIKKNETK